ncbi:putative golgin subfamily A member 6-like protein 3 [Impatiens glandulifera]|uniref:putative golgin subfamily A member 6-like protein 3 n=1 Tax=Impatiens glandulifera TaxID=253017 RepID=UPI001FB0F306|nr:putative golgin subfamily A member 6-like protein 3 [Impatiens glandulifera]
MKGVVVDTIISCLHKYSIAIDEKIAVVQTNLTKTVRASIHSEIVETVQTSIKSMIDESVQTAIAPLLDMMQAMASQIEELSKMQADKTQEQIRADAETARRLQEEDEARERLRKEIEDKDHELAKQCNEEKKAALPESTPAQASHSMKTRNKNKRKTVATLMKQAERSGLEEIQPVGQLEKLLDDEEEEDTTRLNRRKKKAIEVSTTVPSSDPIVAQSSRPPRLVSRGFGFNKRTPGISSVFTRWQIDAERREREWKAREEEERKHKEKEKGGGIIQSLAHLSLMDILLMLLTSCFVSELSLSR